MFRIACSIERDTGTEWEAELLAYSVRRAYGDGPAPPLTIICAGGEPKRAAAMRANGADVFATDNFRWRGDGLDYQPYNKPYGLYDWIERGKPTEQSILIVDPDFVFLAPLPDWTALPSEPLAQEWRLDTAHVDNLVGAAVTQLAKHPELAQPVGVPILIDRDDLSRLCGPWIAYIRLLRQRGLPKDHWIAEMTGYILAAADLEIRHHLTDIHCYPLLHYFAHHCMGTWPWVKFDYKPWQTVKAPPDTAPREARMFADILNEYAGKQTGAAAPTLRVPVGVAALSWER